MQRLLCVILCVSGGWSTVSAAHAEPFQLGPIPVEGVLILRNGQAVAGRLTRAGDHYFVALPEGEIRLRADDVEMACRDLDEAYRRKRAVLAVGDAYRHLELANWCLRHRLLGPAAAELADAMRADPNQPLIPLLQRRLQLALQPAQSEADVESPQSLGPSREELDALVRRLPSGAVESFTADVQPLLMNNCTTSGCHGPNSEHELRLLRVARSRPGGRRATQQNLHAVLQWIDRDAPERSKLLTVPIEPHGGMDRPVFTQREFSQLEQLADWVGRLRNPAEREEVPASVRRMDRPPTAAPPAAVPVAQDNPFSATPESGERPPAVAEEPPEERPRVQRGASLEGSQPVDPFDPAIFNQRYFKDE